jgi:hypothetical protein
LALTLIRIINRLVKVKTYCGLWQHARITNRGFQG